MDIRLDELHIDRCINTMHVYLLRMCMCKNIVYAYKVKLFLGFMSVIKPW